MAAPPPMTGARTAAAAAALTTMLGLAAVSWVVAVRQMNGMDMGVSTQLGSFAFFVALWVSMMAAMMLPGAAPAVVRRVHAGGVGFGPRSAAGRRRRRGEPVGAHAEAAPPPEVPRVGVRP